MRITQEADYAVRICRILDNAKEKTGAKEISEQAYITQKFALKILRKLVNAGIVTSHKGVYGGYTLTRDSNEVTLLDIFETIDGPVQITKCIDFEHMCSKNTDKSECKMHKIMCGINQNLKNDFGNITVRMLNDESISAEDILNRIEL